MESCKRWIFLHFYQTPANAGDRFIGFSKTEGRNLWKGGKWFAKSNLPEIEIMSNINEKSWKVWFLAKSTRKLFPIEKQKNPVKIPRKLLFFFPIYGKVEEVCLWTIWVFSIKGFFRVAVFFLGFKKVLKKEEKIKKALEGP